MYDKLIHFKACPPRVTNDRRNTPWSFHGRITCCRSGLAGSGSTGNWKGVSHPGVIGSGLASLFKPSQPPKQKSQTPEPGTTASSSTSALQSPSMTTMDSADSTLSPVSSYSASTTSQSPKRQNTLFSIGNSDPTFNPKFNNDINLPLRKGWGSAMHFLNKHSDHI